MCTTVKLSSNSFSVVSNKEKVVQLKKLDCEAALSFLKFETFFLRSFIRSFEVIGGEDFIYGETLSLKYRYSYLIPGAHFVLIYCSAAICVKF